MIKRRMVTAPAFRVSGVKVWISGQNNEEFGAFWERCNSDGSDAMALIRAEMEAFMNWLPQSGFRHDSRPEIEVYPDGTGVYVEFWLPVAKK